MHGFAVAILSVCLSVCLSVRHMYCDKTKWCTAAILIPRETAITLVRNKIQLQWNKVCHKVSLCENFQQQSCTAVNQRWNNRKIRDGKCYFSTRNIGLNWTTMLLHQQSTRMLLQRCRMMTRLQIECRQLHSELFGRRHNTPQSHGLCVS